MGRTPSASPAWPSRPRSTTGDAYRLYRWWYGAKTQPASVAAPGHPPADHAALRGRPAGRARPRRQHTFTDGPVPGPAGRRRSDQPLAAYGFQGAPPLPSYSSPADYTFLWYDATAKGPDEEGVQGTGLMRYVNGGARYKAGIVPSGPVPMFTVAGSVTSYATPPDLAPSYPAWPGLSRQRRGHS